MLPDFQTSSKLLRLKARKVSSLNQPRSYVAAGLICFRGVFSALPVFNTLVIRFGNK